MNRKKKLFDWFPFQFNLPENKKEKKLKKEVKKIQKKMSKYALSATYSISQNMGYMKDVIELCKDWNNKENNLNNLTYQEKMKLANQLKNNSRLRELATLIGHLRDLALSTRYAKLKSLPYEIYNIVLGDDLLRIHPVEITYLSHPTFQYDFYQRLAYKKIMQYELKGIETTGQGSIIVCVDTSGSMSGKPEIMSKGVALGLLEIARADKRNFIGIIFGQKQKVKTFVFKQEQVEIYTPNEEVEYVKFLDGLLEFACSFIGGGTDFETPLNTALSFREKEEIYQDADLVFITDDVCDISSAFLEHYSKLKQKRNFRTYGILIGPKSQEPDTMKKFCDEILNYYVFTEEIATSIFEKVAARSRRT